LEKTHFGQHGDGCFGCKIQTIQISPYATPNRLHPERAPRTPNNSWEKGIPTDSRGMPFLKADGSAMGVKEYGEKRHQIEEHRKKLHQAPANPS
jgi:hypothetical protein